MDMKNFKNSRDPVRESTKLTSDGIVSFGISVSVILSPNLLENAKLSPRDLWEGLWY